MTPEIPSIHSRQALSSREKEVVAYVVHGFSNKEIAREMKLSPRTIEDYRLQAFSKLGVRNAVQLTRHVYMVHQ